jgi:hypothetical protein
MVTLMVVPVGSDEQFRDLTPLGGTFSPLEPPKPQRKALLLPFLTSAFQITAPEVSGGQFLAKVKVKLVFPPLPPKGLVSCPERLDLQVCGYPASPEIGMPKTIRPRNTRPTITDGKSDLTTFM